MREEFLIRNTTREQREKIVADSIGNIDGQCDGCAAGIVQMYDDYIEGKLELTEVNARFRAQHARKDENLFVGKDKAAPMLAAEGGESQ